jgi:predicted RNA binding protein YcfA (HicA-like mRNA interferase family)
VSRRLPALKPKDVLRVLERGGFEVHRVTGSHYILKHPDPEASRENRLASDAALA